MDEKVIAAGGRHYLPKDAHMSHSTVVRGYPHLDRWKTIRDEMDPNKRWTSDLARRLQLVGVSQ
jgi:decaprenylphospho-beta-D-ribofuranose 2-oxidase